MKERIEGFFRLNKTTKIILFTKVKIFPINTSNLFKELEDLFEEYLDLLQEYLDLFEEHIIYLRIGHRIYFRISHKIYSLFLLLDKSN